MVIFAPFLFRFVLVFVSFTNNFNAGVHENLFFFGPFLSVERRKNSRSEIYLGTVNIRLETARFPALNLIGLIGCTLL